jgi:hypothetical protein
MKISNDYKIKIFNKEKKKKEKRNAFFILSALAVFYAYFFPIFGLFILVICFIFYRKSKKININNRELTLGKNKIQLAQDEGTTFYKYETNKPVIVNIVDCRKTKREDNLDFYLFFAYKGEYLLSGKKVTFLTVNERNELIAHVNRYQERRQLTEVEIEEIVKNLFSNIENEIKRNYREKKKREELETIYIPKIENMNLPITGYLQEDNSIIIETEEIIKIINERILNN